jgi:addiction module RelB/DinJ family antitoxin
MNTTMQVRIDNKTKKAVSNIFRQLGLDLSAGIKIYFFQVLRAQGIPFPLLTENGFTPEEEKVLLTESQRTQKIYKIGKRRAAKNAKQLFRELKK